MDNRLVPIECYDFIGIQFQSNKDKLETYGLNIELKIVPHDIHGSLF